MKKSCFIFLSLILCIIFTLAACDREAATGDSGGADHSGGTQNATTDDPALLFTSNGDGTCSVSGIGSCTDAYLTIPSVSPTGDRVTSIDDGAFANCKTLKGVVIPASVTKIGNVAFMGCEGLEAVICYGKPDIAQTAFTGCPKASVSFVGNSAPDESNDTDNTSTPDGSDSTDTGDVPTPDSCDTGKHTLAPQAAIAATCTQEGQAAYYLCERCGAAFADANAQNPVELADLVVAVTAHTPDDWTIAKEATVDAAGIRQQLCTNCSHVCDEEQIPMLIASVGLEFQSNGNGTCAVIGMGTCADTEVIIPSHSPTGDLVTSVGDSAFFGVESITKVILPDSVTKIEGSAFYKNISLVYVRIPSTVTSIGEHAFACCYKLADITIPSGIKSIGNWVFPQCDSLTNVTIPDGVTSIGRYAFYGCDSLTNITIPASVQTIRFDALGDCPNLTTITFQGTPEQWNSMNKENLWDNKSGDYSILFSDGSSSEESGDYTWIDCSHCNAGYVTCTRCGGERMVFGYYQNGVAVNITCGGCGGSGMMYCSYCNGNGQVID